MTFLSRKDRPVSWLKPRSGGYSAKPTGLPKPPPPAGIGAASAAEAARRMMLHDLLADGPDLLDVDPALRVALVELGQQYGALGVLRTITKLWPELLMADTAATTNG